MKRASWISQVDTTQEQRLARALRTGENEVQDPGNCDQVTNLLYVYSMSFPNHVSPHKDIHRPGKGHLPALQDRPPACFPAR
ncbi:hypothetical protein VTJ04DRAFT_8645 [Mycothermus thermophilus]|uniref:uncharacterized protein n=1 Tax=Humicola insolens TaxID=85995 RepID=UPI0037439397